MARPTLIDAGETRPTYHTLHLIFVEVPAASATVRMTIAPLAEVAPGIIGSFVAAYAAYYAITQAKIFGGRPVSDMKTLTPAWKEAEAARFMNAVRKTIFLPSKSSWVAWMGRPFLL